ncbi:MAG: BREX system serine/threonine kinase PglW [Pseudonocardia sp.]|nr:BREX system serine/threonine kinase PglW [Pseudonocardia sp.]
MEQSSSRWNEITPSSFDHEKAALAHVRDLLPDRTPYQAWSNFTFLSDQGHVREVDLLVAAPTGLFLIEIKNFRGRLTNRGATWTLAGGRTRSFDNPLPLADQKAKELKSLLGRAAQKDRGVRVPFLRGCVFLAEPGMECALEENQRHHLYVPDDSRSAGVLGRVGADLLLGPVRHAPPDQDFFRALPRLLEKVGIHRTRRSLTVGPWQIDPRPFDTGPTWVDHHASREDIAGQYRRVRIYLYERESDPQTRESVRGAAQRELLATQGIEHPGLLAPRDILDHDMGPALLIEQHPEAQRLDHYLAADGTGLDLPARIGLVRQLAEAVGYAHERRLVHRALSPRAVIVEPSQDEGWDAPRVRVGEWQSAARGLSSSSTSHRVAPTTHAGRHVEASAAVYLAPEFTQDADGTVAIDLFGLGATAYLILTGKAPAADRAALAEQLKTAGGLHPSAVDDSLPGDLDDLIFDSTRPLVQDRIADVEFFLEHLASLSGTDDVPPVVDPWEAQAGTELSDGYAVERVLGTGATARAFLVERDGHRSVLKVGRSAAAEQRLDDEAVVLDGLRHDHLVSLKRGAFALGGGRHAIEIDYAGDQTLGGLLRDEGVQLPDQLQRFGDQLLDAVGYLEGKEVFHRDIKPDNVGVSRHPKRGPDLMLFDFSLAGAATTDVTAGTRGYRDPFLGPPTRPTFDRAAELYAVAVTLHEMASLELPAWGDDGSDAQFVESVTLASEVFDAGLRDGLVGFLTTALHRDADQRFPTAAAMRQAWNRIFTAMDAERPATTSHSDSDDPQEQRDEAAAAATADTALSAAGLSLRAVAVAQRLGADTVGELIGIPNRMLWRARGLSRNTRLELVNRAGTWRKKLPAPGTPAPPDDPVTPVESPRALDTIALALLPAQNTKGVDQREVARAVLGLPDGAGEPPPVRWPSMTDLAPAFGLTRARISQLTQKRRLEWADLPAVRDLADDVAETLRGRGRVAAASELVAELLVARGCADEDDPDRRWACGYAVLRAVVEADSVAEAPRFRARRHGDRMLVALQVGEDESLDIANDDDLIDMAADLADEAIRLAAVDPLPTPVAVVRALETVTRRFELVLAEQRMVQLAAAAAGTVLANARLELYPTDLDPLRALRLSQAGAGIPPEGLTPEALGRRVSARFPGIAPLPDGPELASQLRELGIELRWNGDRLVPPTIGNSSSSRHTSLSSGSAHSALVAASAEGGPDARLGHARRRGGVRVVTFRRSRWLATRERVEGLAGVEPVDASAAFVEALRGVAHDRRIADFDVVLRADAPDADTRARTNLGRVVEEAWQRLEAQWAVTDVLVLDSLTPFGRYAGGMAVLHRILEAARRGGQDPGPRVVVVLCAAQDENEPPRIGTHAVGLVTGEEWVVAPSSWASLTAA